MKKKSITFNDVKIVSEPDGCYTGKQTNDLEQPIQDADDL